ncbi:MAG: glycine cleavage system aminomethyltransferase GcvT [Elusimicrobia bacterium]|nr:glycine cleavage system aminomethyltransferase GcvT [Elusimicrobiota bacterium]
MTATTELRRTPFYGIHKAMGARLVDFHGWELPIQFTSILKEHQAVRSRCGVFDVSHMGQILVEGKQALEFLQKINTNDIAKAAPGKAVYSHMLNEKGGVVDDVIVGCYGPGRYLVVVNAGTADKDFRWYQRHAAAFDVRVENQSDLLCMLAIQGPTAVPVVEAITPGSAPLPRFGVLEIELFGQRAFVQRTGYTGEDGFEIIAPNEIAPRLWEEVVSHGRSYGLAPCGLGARDTLRLEAGLLLYGQDIDDEHTPFEANYGWVVKLEKGDFVGKGALERQKREGLKRRLTGVALSESGVPRAGAIVRAGETVLGSLVSATFSPTLQKGIGVGYLDRPELRPGEMISVEIHGRRVAAEVAAVPFYRREA